MPTCTSITMNLLVVELVPLEVLLQVELVLLVDVLLELMLDVLVMLRVLDVLETSRGPRWQLFGSFAGELRCLSSWSWSCCCSLYSCCWM